MSDASKYLTPEQGVAEFRGLVDDFTDRGVNIDISYPGSKTVNMAGLIFQVIGANGLRPVKSERLWIATKANQFNSLAGLSGQLAIISVIEEPDKLIRQWRFGSAQRMVVTDSQRTLSATEHIAAITDWVRSPHVISAEFEQAVTLDPEEAETIRIFGAEMSQRKAVLTDKLSELARGRHEALISAGTHYDD